MADRLAELFDKHGRHPDNQCAVTRINRANPGEVRFALPPEAPNRLGPRIKLWPESNNRVGQHTAAGRDTPQWYFDQHGEGGK